MISQSIGPFCDVNQDITSWNVSEGAAVALELTEYERESEYTQPSLLQRTWVSSLLKVCVP